MLLRPLLLITKHNKVKIYLNRIIVRKLIEVNNNKGNSFVRKNIKSSKYYEDKKFSWSISPANKKLQLSSNLKLNLQFTLAVA